MPFEPILLTPRAKLFRSLSHDLRVLNQCGIETEEERKLWYLEVQRFREKLRSRYHEIYDELPHELEHYLDDADIRAKDTGYRKRQETFMGEFLSFIAAEIRKGGSEPNQ